MNLVEKAATARTRISAKIRGHRPRDIETPGQALSNRVIEVEPEVKERRSRRSGKIKVRNVRANRRASK